MTIVLARDMARYGIRAVTIAPGTFDTPLMGYLPEEHRKRLAEATPFPPRLGRWFELFLSLLIGAFTNHYRGLHTRPDEFGRLALHIAENQMLNGETIRLDGALRMAAL